jgi:hypothetical protein
MHPTEPNAAFFLLRANGWSIGKISERLGIPRSTLWHWEDKHRREIKVMKSFQLEALQEKYLPSIEEELHQLSQRLARIDSLLDQQDFAQARPEFLFRASLQLRARLQKLRTNVAAHCADETFGQNPLPFLGCISRSEDVIEGESSPNDTSRFEPPNDDRGHSLSSTGGEGQGEGAAFAFVRGEDAPPLPSELSQPEPVNDTEAVPTAEQTNSAPPENGTFRDKNDVSQENKPTESTACNDHQKPAVPFSPLPVRETCPSIPASSVAHSNRSAEIITLCEGFSPSANPDPAAVPLPPLITAHAPATANGTFRNKIAVPQNSAPSASTPSNGRVGAAVPFSRRSAS